MSESFDVGIVGGGIVGLATGLALTEQAPGLSIALLEKEPELAKHQTGHNSGVIHAGIYYKPGSWKARLCVEGVRLMTSFCEEQGIPWDRCGKLIVATDERELPRLDALHERATANRIPGVELVGPERAREIEPHARVVRALHSPNTAIVDFREVALAMGRLLEDRGVRILLDAGVHAVTRSDGRLNLETARGPVSIRRAITCGGLHSDALARVMGTDPEVRVIPFRGEYYCMRTDQKLVRGLIYPVPDPRFPFLGVHFTRRIRGPYEAGPNAVLAFSREGYRRRDASFAELRAMLSWPGFWRMAARHWRMGLYEMYRSLSRPAFVRALQKLVPALRDHDLIRGGSGVRAQAVTRGGELVDDFRILQTPDAIHVVNAPSPAATASIAIGRHIASRYLSAWPAQS